MLCNSRYLSRDYNRIYIPRLKYCNLPRNNKESLSPYINATKLNVRNKFYNLLSWYEQVIGIQEVRMAQNRVIQAGDRFASAQDKRREAYLELVEIKNKIKNVQDELSTVSRGEEKYLTLITQEHKLLKEEVRLSDKFNVYEREERDHFSTLTSAVKESHEYERIQANKTKYLSIIGSVVGTLIGITGSSINNRSKFKEIKNVVLEITGTRIEELNKLCEKLETKFTNDQSFIQANESNISNVISLLEDVKSTLRNVSSHSDFYNNAEKSLLHIEKKIETLLHVIRTSPNDERVSKLNTELPLINKGYENTNQETIMGINKKAFLYSGGILLGVLFLKMVS